MEIQKKAKKKPSPRAVYQIDTASVSPRPVRELLKKILLKDTARNDG